MCLPTCNFRVHCLEAVSMCLYTVKGLSVYICTLSMMGCQCISVQCQGAVSIYDISIHCQGAVSVCLYCRLYTVNGLSVFVQ